MERDEILNSLRRESTWRLFFLGLITLGIYFAYYIKRQTACMNQYLNQEKRISEELVKIILILSYISAIFFIPYILVEEGSPIEAISNLLDTVLEILLVIWAFKARNRMNMLLSATKGSEFWFHGLWTFLFTALYFNFKINKLSTTVTKTEPKASPQKAGPYREKW